MADVNTKLTSVKGIPFGIPFNIFIGPPFAMQDTDVYIVLPFNEKHVRRYNEYYSASVSFVLVNREDIRLCKADTCMDNASIPCDYKPTITASATADIASSQISDVHVMSHGTVCLSSLETAGTGATIDLQTNPGAPISRMESSPDSVSYSSDRDDTDNRDKEIEHITTESNNDHVKTYIPVMDTKKYHLLSADNTEALPEPVPIRLVENIGPPCTGDTEDERTPISPANDWTTDHNTDGPAIDWTTDHNTDGPAIDWTTDHNTDGPANDWTTDHNTDGPANDWTTDHNTDGPANVRTRDNNTEGTHVYVSTADGMEQKPVSEAAAGHNTVGEKRRRSQEDNPNKPAAVRKTKKCEPVSEGISAQVVANDSRTRSSRIKSRGWRPNYSDLGSSGYKQTSTGAERHVAVDDEGTGDIKIEIDRDITDADASVATTEPRTAGYRPIFKKPPLQNDNNVSGNSVKDGSKETNSGKKRKKKYKLKHTVQYSKTVKIKKRVQPSLKEMKVKNKLLNESLTCLAELACGMDIHEPLTTTLDMRTNNSVKALPNNRFKCKLCLTFITDREELMPGHLKNHEMKIFKCTHCSLFVGEDVNDLKHHIFQQHLADAMKSMQMIGTKFVRKKGKIIKYQNKRTSVKLKPRTREIKLENHPDKFRIEITKSLAQCDRGKPEDEISSCTYTCTVCNAYQTRSKESMESHLAGHENGEFSCPYCDFEAVSSSNLKMHVGREHHARYICDSCGAVKCTLSSFRNHLASTHNKPLFTCDYCSSEDNIVSFSSKRVLEKHQCSTHKDKAVSCKSCDKSFMTEKQLTTHMEGYCNVLLGKETAHTCAVCKKIYSKASMLKVHIRATHDQEKRYKCHLCNYAAFYKPALQNHINKHLGIHLFSCKLCAFTSVKKDQLTSHMKTHTGEKPFRCDQCPYASAWNVQLKGHKKVHDLPNTVICSQCGVVVKNRKALASHENKTHKELEHKS